ncbi:MAG: hypothetical protein H6Q89_5163 [Myxococcaceae bacterium]|nr:hypothetical protein [Myxococcaceae bacterium]
MLTAIALIAEPAIGSSFGARDIAGLIFIGVAILAIWVAFRRLLIERGDDGKPPAGPPK